MFATINDFTIVLEKNKKTLDSFPTYSYRVITAEPRTLFQGTNFKPSVAGVRNELIIPIELLQWVCLEYETNDHSLFEHYTKEQLEFASCRNIEEYSADADQFWLLIDNKQYMFSVNEYDNFAIIFNGYHTPYIFMGDRQ
jgi:hypothetical protein